MTLNCFSFLLEQDEFKRLDIKSANIYLKLDLNALSEQLFYPLDFSPEQADEMFMLYIQVNGKVAKKIDLATPFKQRDYDQSAYESSEFATTKRSREPLFDFVDIKEIVVDEISRRARSKSSETKPVINVKLFARAGLLNYTRSGEKLLTFFSHIDEQYALHANLDEKAPLVPPLIRRSRSNNMQQYANAKARRYSKHHTKNYRDCSELKKAGYTASNYTCCRETISFSMEQLGWSHWILSPKVIEYKYCRGGCSSRWWCFRIQRRLAENIRQWIDDFFCFCLNFELIDLVNEIQWRTFSSKRIIFSSTLHTPQKSWNFWGKFL